MKILALNCGSSSIKCTLFDSDQNFEILIKASAERIGTADSSIKIQGKEKKESMPDYRTAMEVLHGHLAMHKVKVVGHRIVHGGETLKDPIVIDEKVIEEIKEAAKFAPLHSEPNLVGIEAARAYFPNIPHVAVFDTALYKNLPQKAYLYGLPIEFYEKYHIRKFGFHGINHSYVAKRAAELLNKPLTAIKIITCHLGSGCSITAFNEGIAVDTSMGMTPLEGLVMGTRSGDLDPSIVLYLMSELKMSTEEVTELLNKKSGLLGLCGSNDMRDIFEVGDERSKTAIEVFVYRVQKYMGAYIAVLNGVDVIVFTGGIGQNSSAIRRLVMNRFTYVGAEIDKARNDANDTIFSGDRSRVILMTIPANEELVIAKECLGKLNFPSSKRP